MRDSKKLWKCVDDIAKITDGRHNESLHINNETARAMIYDIIQDYAKIKVQDSAKGQMDTLDSMWSFWRD